MTKRTRLEVTWAEFEPLLSQLRQVANCTQSDAFELLGYSSSMTSSWQKTDAVPVIAINAIRWVLHDLGAQTPKKPERIRFTDAELEDLFLVLRGRMLPDEDRKRLIAKLAGALTS